jgi:salicylate hydroxylase
VLIAGAGIGGLSAALALLQRGFAVDVYEQASKLEEVGAWEYLDREWSRTAITTRYEWLSAYGVLGARI